MKDIIITTTSSIENKPIQEYLGLVCSSLVIGTNLFSDMSASLSDIFGGKSSSYERKLEIIREEAISDLKNKTIKKGGNAILGLHIDIDEISGGGKSMFMVSASGTACKLQEDNNQNSISSAKIQDTIEKIRIINQIKEAKPISDEDFEFMINNPSTDYLYPLIEKYIYYANSVDQYDRSILYITKVISNLPYDITTKVLYNKLKEDVSVLDIIRKCQLFDPSLTLDLIQIDLKKAIGTMNADKPYYDRSDLQIMDKIITQIDNLPDKGKYEIVKGLFGKENKKYICPNGHKNDIDHVCCSECGENIKGLSPNELSILDMFKLKIQAIRSSFN